MKRSPKKLDTKRTVDDLLCDIADAANDAWISTQKTLNIYRAGSENGHKL